MFLKSIINRTQTSSENSKLLWGFCPGRTTEIQAPSKDEGLSDIWYSMSMLLDTKETNFGSQ